MDHDHGTNASGRVAPRSLLDKLFLALFVLKPNIKHFGKILA